MSYRQRHIHPKIRSLRHRKYIFQKRWFWVALAVILVLGGIGYTMLFYSKFQIAEITILGNEHVQTKDLEAIALNSAKSIFIFNAKKLETRIAKSFPQILNITAEKKLPNKLFVKVSERVPVAAFCAQSCLAIDENGIVFDGPTAASPRLVIKNQDDAPIAPGANPVSKEMMGAIVKVAASLKSNFQVGVREVEASDLLIFTTSENWKLYIDPASRVDAQIARMEVLLKNEISEAKRKTLRYIYLQYADRAYYK